MKNWTLKLVRWMAVVIIGYPAFGQNTGQNVVTSFAINSTTAITNATYTCSTSSCTPGIPIQNIGQTNHILIISVTASNTNMAIFSCQLQGSQDGTNWYGIGIATSNLQPSGVSQSKCSGYGSSPYVRSVITTTGVTGNSVTFSALYIGNSIPSNVLVDMSGLNSQMKNSHISGLVGSNVSTQLIAGIAGASISIYGMQVQSDATGTTMLFSCSTNSGSGNLWVYGLDLVPTTGTIKYPPNLRPLMTCLPGDSINYQLVGTPVANISFQYRAE